MIPYMFLFLGELDVSLDIDNVTSSSVKLHYSISPQLQEVSDLTFNIYYNSTTTNVTQSSPDFTKLSDNKTLNNLLPNTEYVLWITAKTSDGITLSSESTSFKTLLVGKSMYELYCHGNLSSTNPCIS